MDPTIIKLCSALVPEGARTLATAGRPAYVPCRGAARWESVEQPGFLLCDACRESVLRFHHSAGPAPAFRWVGRDRRGGCAEGKEPRRIDV